MSYSLHINLDNVSKGLFVNQNPPFYLHLIKDVSVGNALATPTTWLVHKVVGGNIAVSWNSTYEVFYSSNAIKPGNLMTQTNKTRTPANTGYSYKWDGKAFTVSGQTNNKGAIEVVNATGETGVFGISQTVNDGIDAISLGVSSIPNGGKIEFKPEQNVTMWMAKFNSTQSNAIVSSAQLGVHGTMLCRPNERNEIALNDGRWVPVTISGGSNSSNKSVNSDNEKDKKKKETPDISKSPSKDEKDKAKESPKEVRKEEPKKEDNKAKPPDNKKPEEKPKDAKAPDPKAAAPPAMDPKKKAEEDKKKAAEEKKKQAEDKKKAEAEKKKAAEEKKKEEAKKKEEEKKKAAEAKKKADEDKKKAAEDKKKADAAKKSPQPARKNSEPANDRRESKPEPKKDDKVSKKP